MPVRSPSPVVLLVALVLFAPVAGVAATTATAQGRAVVVGQPELTVYAPDAAVVPGTETTVDVFVANDGAITRGGPEVHERRVTTARATALTVRSGDTPLDVRTGRYPVGTVPTGTTGPIPVSLVVPEDAPPGTYRLPVAVTYTYTQSVEYRPGSETDVSYTDATVTRRTTLVVRVENRPRFRVVGATTDLAPGESGVVSVAMANVGTRAAREASVVVASPDPDLQVGAPAAATDRLRNETTPAVAGVGTWPAGERRRVTLPARLALEATAREYPLRALVTYTDADGIVRRSREHTVVVRSAAPVRFAVRNVTADLRVGAEGTLRGRLVNEGGTPVRDAVLVLRSSGAVEGGASVDGADREYALGDLPPGEGAPFSFSVPVSDAADPGPRQVAFVVRYAAPDGRTVASDPLRTPVTVADRRDVFRIDPVAARFRVDSDGRLAVRVTNADTAPVRDVEVSLNATDPLSSDAPSAFVPRLAPGETVEVGFALSVSSDAVASTYPVRLAFRYETPDGEDRTSGPYPVGVTVVEAGATEPLLVALTLLVALLVVGLWWRARR